MADELKKIIRAAKAKGYTIDSRPYKLNLIGVRNSKATNQQKFDDKIAYFYYDDKGNLIGKVAVATTDPSTYFLQNPMKGVKKVGTAILKSGEYKDTYEIGLHRGKYKALRQKETKPVTVIRDNDRNAFINYFAPTQTGIFYINIHRASRGKNNVAVIDKDSAGCQTFQNEADFNAMMNMAETSRAKYGNSFSYILLDDRDILKFRNTFLLIAGLGLLTYSYFYFKKK